MKTEPTRQNPSKNNHDKSTNMTDFVLIYEFQEYTKLWNYIRTALKFLDYSKPDAEGYFPELNFLDTGIDF
uniref:Uncharacterized protein n=1 Tax=Romanomermis culicivorax TaxID=13658 RepID=A0A915L3J0_ROMCU